MADTTDPAPRQPGLTDQQQRFIDAHNFDEIADAVEQGHRLTGGEKATWKALAERLGRPDPTSG